MSEIGASRGGLKPVDPSAIHTRAGTLGTAVLAAAAALWLAAQHPLAPGLLASALCLLAGWICWKPWSSGMVLAALLPVASLAPETGWWLVEEFDLLVLGVLAGGYGRWCLDSFAGSASAIEAAAQHTPSASYEAVWVWLSAALGATALFSLWIGLRDAGVDFSGATAALSSRDWLVRALHADYASALNPLRVSKSLLWVLLLFPLMRRGDGHQQRQMVRLTVAGMVAGLVLVCLLVIWERLRYVGVFNVTESYRTSAAFWEMHVGGGAIDAYLALVAPAAFWAVWMAPTGWRWAGAAGLAVLATYAVLTTYSRGLYVACALAVMFMLIAAWRFGIRPRAGGQRRRFAVVALLLALLAEAAWVLGGQSVMSDRLARSETDLLGRVAHWRDGMGLLKGPADWWTGLGAGRLPARYSAEVPGGEFPGRAQWQGDDSDEAHVSLSGPPTRQDIAYDFALVQRVELSAQGAYRVRLRYQTGAPLVLLVSVCERHLLYDFRCQWKHVRPPSAVTDGTEWHEIALSGPPFAAAGRAAAWREGMFAVTVLSPGQTAQLHRVELLDPLGRQVLRNTDFSTGLRYWLPAAQGHFKPWHMDNFYLEVLIERGLIGWLVLASIAGWAGRALWLALRHQDPLALALAGSLVSMAVVGLVISVTEMPRIAFLLLLIVLTTSRLQRIPQYSPLVTDCNHGVRAVFSDGRQSREEPQRPSQGKEV